MSEIYFIDTVYFISDIQLCQADEVPVPDTNIGAAVAVGIALAVMIVLVVLLYFIITKIRVWLRLPRSRDAQL